MGVRIVHTDRGVDFVEADKGVSVDASAHDLRLLNHRAEPLHVGALRAGLLTATGFVSEALGMHAAGSDHAPVQAALAEALARAAQARGVRDPALEAAIAAIYPTPLLHSARFLESHYLWQDAFRFRACRIAIANAEDDHIDEDTPEVAANVVEKLLRWRDLYAGSGKAKRALNAALQDFGETMPAVALWGLRKVTLGRPRTEQLPLEVLGFLGALGDAEALAPVMMLVEGAPDEEMHRLLAGELLLPAGIAPQDLAMFLAHGDPASRTLLQLVRSSIERVTRTQKDASFARPPIPLPLEEGLTFVSGAKALEAESARMHHCVRTLEAACARGDAFVFHAERDGSHGTIHVDAAGRVVQFRGPFNRSSLAATWGAQLLSKWGAGMWLGRFSPDTLAWPPGLDAPPGMQPLRSARAIHDAYRALCAQRPERAADLAVWFARITEEAVGGRAGVCWRDADRERVFVLRPVGGVLGQSDDAGTLQAMPQRPGVVAPARELALFAAPPIPPPRIPDHRLLTHTQELAGAEVPAASIAGAIRGEVFFFRVDFGQGAIPLRGARVLMEIALGGEIVERHSVGALASQRQQAHEAARRWAHGLWVARLGEHVTWHGGRRVPHGAEALRTVSECALVYGSICLSRGDHDGALSRFFETHVAAAIRGDAWLLVRDRSEGLVTVLDKRGNVTDRTDEILSPPQGSSRAQR